MNFIQRFAIPFARSMPQHVLPAAKTYPKSAMVALRLFSSKNEKPDAVPLFPLHDAIRDGSAKAVKEVLLTDPFADVNGLNDKGESPLGIAVDQYFKQNECSEEVLDLLYEWGACYALEDGNGNDPQTLLLDKYSESVKYVGLKTVWRASCHNEFGCGLSISRCTNPCTKESKLFNPAQKAKVAFEALTSSRSVTEIAKKHGVSVQEVIKLRSQARAGMADIFD